MDLPPCGTLREDVMRTTLRLVENPICLFGNVKQIIFVRHCPS